MVSEKQLLDSKCLIWSLSAGFTALTTSQHEGTFAHAVIIVHVLGTEVCSMDDQTALSARSPTVAFQEQSETHHRGRKEEEEGGVSAISNKDSKET